MTDTETRARARCLAVEDHPATRAGLARLLASVPDIELVGSLDCGDSVLEAIQIHRPSVAIVDARLPGVRGIELVERIAAHAPEVKIVMFSAYRDGRLPAEAIGAGARGYVMKGSPPNDLIRAIRIVDRGGSFIDPSLAPALLLDGQSREAPLSDRERDVLQSLADGLHTHEAAKHVGIPERTVKSDIKRAIMKLEVSNRVQAVAVAMRQALIE